MSRPKCPTCGTEFTTRKSRPATFCKRTCIRGINKGEANGQWKGGMTGNGRGYIKVMAENHPRSDRDGYVLEHILVAEKGLGRKLKGKEVVHHLNGDKRDNRIENLLVFGSHSDHLKYGHHRKVVIT